MHSTRLLLRRKANRTDINHRPHGNQLHHPEKPFLHVAQLGGSQGICSLGASLPSHTHQPLRSSTAGTQDLCFLASPALPLPRVLWQCSHPAHRHPKSVLREEHMPGTELSPATLWPSAPPFSEDCPGLSATGQGHTEPPNSHQPPQFTFWVCSIPITTSVPESSHHVRATRPQGDTAAGQCAAPFLEMLRSMGFAAQRSPLTFS